MEKNFWQVGISDIGYLKIQFPSKPNTGLYHPTWELVFYDEEGKVLADYREPREEAIT